MNGEVCHPRIMILMKILITKTLSMGGINLLSLFCQLLRVRLGCNESMTKWLSFHKREHTFNSWIKTGRWKDLHGPLTNLPHSMDQSKMNRVFCFIDEYHQWGTHRRCEKKNIRFWIKVHPGFDVRPLLWDYSTFSNIFQSVNRCWKRLYWRLDGHPKWKDLSWH